MDRYDIEFQQDEEQSAQVAMAMVSVVAAMALVVLATVLVFWSGGGIV